MSVVPTASRPLKLIDCEAVEVLPYARLNVLDCDPSDLVPPLVLVDTGRFPDVEPNEPDALNELFESEMSYRAQK